MFPTFNIRMFKCNCCQLKILHHYKKTFQTVRIKILKGTLKIWETPCLSWQRTASNTILKSWISFWREEPSSTRWRSRWSGTRGRIPQWRNAPFVGFTSSRVDWCVTWRRYIALNRRSSVCDATKSFCLETNCTFTLTRFIRSTCLNSWGPIRR